MAYNVNTVWNAINNLQHYNPELSRDAHKAMVELLKTHKPESVRSPIRTTHTYSIMEVSEAAFEEVRKNLQDAGYNQAINRDKDGLKLDMHGIALSMDAAKPFVVQMRFDKQQKTAYLWVGDCPVVSTQGKCVISFWGVEYALSIKDGARLGDLVAAVDIQSDEGDPMGAQETSSHSWVEISI